MSSASGPFAALVGLNPSNQWTPVSIDAGGNLKTAVSGAGSGGTSAVDGSNFSANASAGTPCMGAINPVGASNNTMDIIALDANRNVKVNIVAGAAGNPAASNTGSAVPAAADYLGINVGGTLQGGVGFDLDTGAGTQYVLGVNLRGSNSGGSFELGTLANPVRTDPTGTTSQPVTIASGNSNVTVSGTASVNVAQVSGTAADVNTGNASNGTQRVVLATNQPSVPVTPAANSTVVISSGNSNVTINANASVNVNQIAGTATDVNTGNASNGTQRVVLATNQPSVPVTPSANSTVIISSGNSNVAVTGTVAVTESGAWNVGSSSGTGAAVPANAFYHGGIAENSALPAKATAGNLTGVMVDQYGRMVNTPIAPRGLVKTAVLSSNNNAATTLIPAGGASNFCDIVSLTITNEANTATVVTLNDNGGANGTSYKFAIAPLGGITFNPQTPLPQGANANVTWTVLNSAAVGLDYVAMYVISQ